MPIPPHTLKAYEKTRVDHAIDAFAKLEKPTIADLHRVKVQAEVQCKIDEYRLDAIRLGKDKLETELHVPERMAQLMAASGDPRPAAAEHCHCHAIVSGAHNDAAMIRAVLAWCMMRIDDPRNGCWLPRNTKARAHMPHWLANAAPHSRIHRNSYYRWLGDLINPMMVKSCDDLLQKLRMIRMRLQSGSLPKHILSEMGL